MRLVEAARRHGVYVLIDSRVERIAYEGKDRPVELVTSKGVKYQFDLLIGSEGIKSVVRKNFVPGCGSTSCNE